MLASGSPTVASGQSSAKFPTWIKPLGTPVLILRIYCNQTLHHIRARCDGELWRALPTQVLFCSQQTFWHISTHSIIIIIASLSSILLLLVSIFLGATLSTSSQRHLGYILDLNCTTALDHLVSNKPVASFYDLSKKIYI